MNIHSKSLIQFLKREFPDLLKGAPKLVGQRNRTQRRGQYHSQFSKKSQQMMMMLYSLIQKSDTSWKLFQSHIQETALSKITDDATISQGANYDYIPQEIRAVINDAVKWKKTYEFRIHSDTYKVNMILPIKSGEVLSKAQHTKYERFCRESLYKIYLWLSVADQFAPHECSPVMNINLFFTDHLKTLAKTKMEPLDQHHVNTAFTTSCAPSTEINIFRSEEWFKVFIHETFHNLGMDFSEMDCSEADSMMLHLFPIQASEIRLFETYCEMWAEIMNVLFTVFFSNQRSSITKSKIQVLQEIERLLKLEAAWSVFQSGKVLDHYGLTYDQLTDKTSHASSAKRTAQYKEKTYVLSYYIIKSVFMTHMNSFIEWCIAHKGSISFEKTPKRIREYCGLVQRLYQSPEYLSRIKIVQHWFQRNNHRPKDFVLNTMRMTALG